MKIKMNEDIKQALLKSNNVEDFMERIDNMLEIEIKVLEDLPNKEKDSGANPDENKKGKYKREEGF